MLLRPLADGAVGKAVAAGVAKVRVYVNSPTDKFCDVSEAETVGDETCYLGTGSSGTQIFWLDPDAAAETIGWAIVRLGGGGEPGIAVRNDSGEEVPPWAAMAVTDVISDGDGNEEFYVITKPNATLRRVYLFNGAKPIATGEFGYGFDGSDGPVRVSVHSAYNPGVSFAPKPGSWELWEAYPSVGECLGIDDSGTERIFPHPIERFHFEAATETTVWPCSYDNARTDYDPVYLHQVLGTLYGPAVAQGGEDTVEIRTQGTFGEAEYINDNWTAVEVEKNTGILVYNADYSTLAIGGLVQLGVDVTDPRTSVSGKIPTKVSGTSPCGLPRFALAITNIPSGKHGWCVETGLVYVGPFIPTGWTFPRLMGFADGSQTLQASPLDCFDAIGWSSENDAVFGYLRSVNRLQQFVLTADLAKGSSAAANLLFNGSSCDTMENLVVYDDHSHQQGTQARHEQPYPRGG